MSQAQYTWSSYNTLLAHGAWGIHTYAIWFERFKHLAQNGLQEFLAVRLGWMGRDWMGWVILRLLRLVEHLNRFSRFPRAKCLRAVKREVLKPTTWHNCHEPEVEWGWVAVVVVRWSGESTGRRPKTAGTEQQVPTRATNAGGRHRM